MPGWIPCSVHRRAGRHVRCHLRPVRRRGFLIHPVPLKKEYPRLKILAVQFDNGFISETALENARKFCTLTNSAYLRLALDQDTLRDTFHKAAVSTDAYPGSPNTGPAISAIPVSASSSRKLSNWPCQPRHPISSLPFHRASTDAPFITLTKPFLGWMSKNISGEPEGHGSGRDGMPTSSMHTSSRQGPGPK